MDYFEEKKVARIAKEHLDETFSTHATRDEVYKAFFLNSPSDDPEIMSKWLNALRDDPDIREWIVPRFKAIIEELEERRNELRVMLEGLKVS